MSRPPFTMSKYLTELDLQRDARKYYQIRSEQLEEALLYAIEWIDAVPRDTELPTMLGFDRDWVNEILEE